MYVKNVADILGLLYSPDDEIGGVATDDEVIADDTNDDDKNDDKGEDDTDDDTSDADAEEDTDDDEDKDKDTEDDEEDDEDEESEDDVNLASYSDIKEKYPKIFKEFPDLRAAIFRDQQYSTLLGSPKAAEQAVGKANALDKLEEDLINQGNPIDLLKLLESENKETFKTSMLQVLPFIQETDKDLYYDIVAVPIKQLLRKAFREGNGKEGDLGRAALYIHKFFFDNTEINSKVAGEDKITSKGKTKEQIEYEKKLEEIDTRQYREYKSSVDNSYVKKMQDFIVEGIKDDERITPYLQRSIINDVLTAIKEQLDGDDRYLANINTLWKQAKANGWDNASKSRIINTALARAKSLVPKVRSKIIAEALGKGKKKDKDDIKRFSKREDRQDRQRIERKPERKGPVTDMDILTGKA